MSSGTVDMDLEVYDVGEVYDMLHETRWRETPFPILDSSVETEAFDPTLPPNVNDMDLDDLRRWLRTYAAWMEYVSNQKVLMDSMVRSKERELDVIDSGIRARFWHEFGKKQPPEDVRKALVKTNRAWIAADGELAKYESLKSAMASRLEKLGRSRTTIEILISVRQSELKYLGEGARG